MSALHMNRADRRRYFRTSRPIKFVPQDRAFLGRTAKALRTVRAGRPNQGWFGLLADLYQRVKQGRAAIEDLRESWRELAAAGMDNAARHIHPRHRRTA